MTNYEINEEKLNKVAGGSNRIKDMTLQVTLPSTGYATNKVTVYVDGVLKSALSNEYDGSVELIKITIPGSSGQKRVDIKVNNVAYKTYIVDFDKNSYSEY